MPCFQAAHLGEPPFCGLVQLHDNYSGEVLVTPTRLFVANKPCTLQLPDGTRHSCFYQGALHRRFADGWPAVSDALGLAPSDIVQLQQLAAGSTDFLIAKVTAEAAAAAGFSVQPMSETERVRRFTAICEDGTVSIPLSEAALGPQSPWFAPATLQLWSVSGEEPCTLVLPSGKRQERSIYRPHNGPNGVIKGWRSATAELQLQASDTLRIHTLQQRPLQLAVFADRPAAGAAPEQQAGSGAAEAVGVAASADEPAPSGGAPAADAVSGPSAEAAIWQQWCPLGWRGTRLLILERQHLFPAVGTKGRRLCTLLLPDGLEINLAAKAYQTGVSLDGVAAVGDALQLEPGSLLQFRQDAPGSRRFHVQKLPPEAATIPPLHDYLSEQRQRNSKTAVLPDGTVRWPATAHTMQTLQIPAAASDHLQLAGCAEAVFQLPDGQQHVRALSMRGPSCHVYGWKRLAAALQLAAGDLLHMRATQRTPLQLQVYVTHPDGVPEPDATAVQQVQALQPQPLVVADVEAAATPDNTAAATAAAAAADAHMLDIAVAPALTPGEAAAGSSVAAAGSADDTAMPAAVQPSPLREQPRQQSGMQMQL